jgi:hypothetical protein
LEKLKLSDVLKLKKPKLLFLNQIKIQLLEKPKTELLKIERLVISQRLHEKLFFLMKLERLLLTLQKPMMKKKRRDATLLARFGGLTERRRKVQERVAPARSTWADHWLPDICRRKPTR